MRAIARGAHICRIPIFHIFQPLSNANITYGSSLVVEGVADLPHLLHVLPQDVVPRGEHAPRRRGIEVLESGPEGRGGRFRLRQCGVFPPAFLSSVRRDTLAFVRLLSIPERGHSHMMSGRGRGLAHKQMIVLMGCEITDNGEGYLKS